MKSYDEVSGSLCVKCHNGSHTIPMYVPPYVPTRVYPATGEQPRAEFMNWPCGTCGYSTQSECAQ